MAYIAEMFAKLSLSFCYFRRIYESVFCWAGEEDEDLLSLLLDAWYHGSYPLLVKHTDFNKHLISDKAQHEWEKLE